MYRRKGKSRAKVPPTIWSALPLLEAAQTLNRRSVVQLASVAPRHAVDGGAVFAPAELWGRIDERGTERAGRCPVLLLNLEFGRASWWHHAAQNWPGRPPGNNRGPVFEEGEIEAIAREVLTEAWSGVRINRYAAKVIYGMSAEVAEILAGLPFYEVDRIATSFSISMRPRFEESQTFWSGLLEAAVSEDNEALTRVHLHALQLLGSETVSRHA